MSKTGRPRLTALPRSQPEQRPIPDQVRQMIAPHAQAAALANARMQDILNGWLVGVGIDTATHDVQVQFDHPEGPCYSVAPKAPAA